MTCGPSFILLLLTLVAISADVDPLAAHVGDRLYPFSYLSEETLAALDRNDASVEDWVEVIGEPTLTTLDFDLASHGPGVTSYDQYDPTNLDFRIWLGWSLDGKVHVAGQFADDVYYNEYGSGPGTYSFGLYDNITLFVDGDHTGGEYWFRAPHGEEPEGPLETNMQAQFYSAVSRAVGHPLVDLPFTTDWEVWMVLPPFADGGGGVLGENPTFWSVEFYVTCFDRLNHLSPEDSDVSQLTEGKIIGFDIGVGDFDDDSGLRAHYYIARPDGFEPDFKDASTMLDGLLLGPAGESGDSSVQSVSWGRIKASLGIDLRSKNDRPGKD